MKKSVFIAILFFVSILFLRGGIAASKQDKFSMSQIYSIDTGHSYAGFSIKNMGFAKVRGRFSDFAGTLRYVEDDITKTSATFTMKTGSINTELEFRDRDLKSDNWFDVEKYPEITFQSKRAEKTDKGFNLIGDLTIKNVTKEIALIMDPASVVLKDIRDDTQVIFTGILKINRKEFGVSGDNWSRIKEGIAGVGSMAEIELTILGKRSNAPNFRGWVRNIETPHGRIYKTVLENGVESGLKEFSALHSANEKDISPKSLNIVGYMLLKEGRIDDAIRIFKHNVSTYPDNPNTYDSLGEAYAVKGDFENAIKKL